MNFDRKSALILVVALAISAALFWAGSSDRDRATPLEPDLPIVQVEMKATLDEFIEQFDKEPFVSLGVVHADVTERELIIGWDQRWMSLPRIYRREVIAKVGEPWARYLGGVTRIYAVPDGTELASYTAQAGVRLRELN